MAASTLTTTKTTSRSSGKRMAVKVAASRQQQPLSGQGTWIRVDDVWYTKNEAGEIVPIKN